MFLVFSHFLTLRLTYVLKCLDKGQFHRTTELATASSRITLTTVPDGSRDSTSALFFFQNYIS